MALGVVRGLVVARLLGPSGRGVLYGMRIIAGYFGHSHLGLLHGMNRLMPLRLGEGRRHEAERYQDTGFTTSSALAVLGALALVAYAAWFAEAYQPLTRLSIALAGVLVIAQQGMELLKSLLRTFGEYGLIARQVTLSAYVEFLLLIGLTWRYGLAGGIGAVTASAVLSYLYLVWRSGFRLRVRLAWPEAKQLLAAGVPLLVLGLADLLLKTIDRVLVLKFQQAHGLGLYGVGGQLAAALNNVPAAVAYVLFPRVLEAYGRQKDSRAIRHRYTTPTAALAILMPAAAGVLCLLTPLLLQTLLPQYVAGTRAVQALLIGSVLLSVPIMAGNYLIAVEKDRYLVTCRIAGAAVVAAGTLLVVRARVPVEELLFRVAGAACVGYLVNSILTLQGAAAQYLAPGWPRAKRLLLLHAPLVYALAALWGAHRLVGFVFAGQFEPWSDIADALVFLLLYAPLLRHVERRTGVVAALVGAVRARGRSSRRKPRS